MASPSHPSTTGSSTFDPDRFFETWRLWSQGEENLPSHLNLRAAIITAFGLEGDDEYVYHAGASVTLRQVQAAVECGGQGGLHDWYLEEEEERGGKAHPPPPAADISAYTQVFAATTSTPKALTALGSNAKKGSLRASVAAHLTSLRVIPAEITVRKLKTPHLNPYYDFWSWSCRNLEWCGPTPGTAAVKTSHYVLPVFMHHFGCVVPSYEALEVIQHMAQGTSVLEIGSGNGYWSYMLRRHGVETKAVDNGESEWRTIWVADTIFMDGETYLKRERGASDDVLLLVYPIVGAGFTGRILKAYEGRTICVAGTQNGSGYTGFRDWGIEEFVERKMPGWRKRVQIALPSFAGKDEALFVFERDGGERT